MKQNEPNPFMCPECGGTLAFGVVEKVVHFRTITPDGMLRRKITPHSFGNDGNEYVVQCIDCAWSGVDGDYTYKYTTAMIDTDQIEKLANFVNDKVRKNQHIGE